MKVKRRYFYCALLFIMGIFFICTFNVYSVDNLRLWGNVKEIDYKGGTIVIDVKSKQCAGLRRFKNNDMLKIDDSFIGKGIIFFIDSSECTGDKIYKIMMLKNGEKR